MKLTLLSLLFSSLTATVSAVAGGKLQEGQHCNVTFVPGKGKSDGKYQDWDPEGDGSTVCEGTGPDGLECNYQIDDSGNTTEGELIGGTCEKKCMGNNSNKPPETGSHRVTICHRTCSPTNPWVRITIDDDAWAGGATCGHGTQHDIEQDCNRDDLTPWGGKTTDHLLKYHGTRAQVAADNGWLGDDGNVQSQFVEAEKEYWKTWEHACPYVRNGKCCDIDKGECCGSTSATTTTEEPPTHTTTTTTEPTHPTTTTTDEPPTHPTTTTTEPTHPTTTVTEPTHSTTTTTEPTHPTTTTTSPHNNGGGGGDPHFQRWGQEHDSFHGECDLVMVHSDSFHDGAGFDLHARTTIQDYFSYIETMAMKVGDNHMEFYNDHFYLNGMKLTPTDLPLTFGDDMYTIENGVVEHGKNTKYYQYYKVNLYESSSVLFKFYKKFLTFVIIGHPEDFADSVGLMGEFYTGDMISRDGERMHDFVEYGFEWQVAPADGSLFRSARSPQLPYELCRMPTGSRPARRRLRANTALYTEAQKACAHVSGKGRELCVDDVLQTGDIGLASLW
eukprot:scaffold34878_cov183-Amphora_coffeaeformis.AAC.3